jgi:hypothetical protein
VRLGIELSLDHSERRRSLRRRSCAASDTAEEIGSLRNARVAIARGAAKSELVYFASELTDEQRH